MWVAMSAAERDEFLAGVHVGVLSAAIGTAGQTLAVPVWYSYQPGGLLTVLTGRRPLRPVRTGRQPALSLRQRRGASPPRGRTRSRRAAGNGVPLPWFGRRYPVRHRQPGPPRGERGVPDAPGALAQPGSGHAIGQRPALPRHPIFRNAVSARCHGPCAEAAV